MDPAVARVTTGVATPPPHALRPRLRPLPPIYATSFSAPRTFHSAPLLCILFTHTAPRRHRKLPKLQAAPSVHMRLASAVVAGQPQPPHPRPWFPASPASAAATPAGTALGNASPHANRTEIAHGQGETHPAAMGRPGPRRPLRGSTPSRPSRLPSSPPPDDAARKCFTQPSSPHELWLTYTNFGCLKRVKDAGLISPCMSGGIHPGGWGGGPERGVDPGLKRPPGRTNSVAPGQGIPCVCTCPWSNRRIPLQVCTCGQTPLPNTSWPLLLPTFASSRCAWAPSDRPPASPHGRALGAGERRSCAPGAHSAWAGSCGSSAPVLRCPRARPHDRTTARPRDRTTARLRGSPPLRRADAAAPPHALTGTDTNACACMRICSHTRTRPYLQLRVGYG